MLDPLITLVSNAWFLFLGIVALGSCVFVHELGHFLAARKRGLKVERFSIGFGPRVWGWTRDGVDYRLSLIPFGGYVALPQLADMGSLEGGEGEDRESKLPQISYTDKMIVSVMGAVFNIIFAAVLSIALWATGQEVALTYQQTQIGYVSETVETDEGTEVPAPAHLAGMQAGDIITHIDGVPVDDWMDVRSRIITGVGRTEDNRPLTAFTVRRGDQILELKVSPILATRESTRLVGIVAADLLEVSDRIPEAFADVLQPGDKVTAYNGAEAFALPAIYDDIRNNPGEEITLTLQRGEQTFTVNTTPEMTELENGGTRFDFGFGLRYRTEVIYPNPVTQFADKMELMYLTLRGLLNRDSDIKVRNMSGPVGIIDNFQESVRYGIKPLMWLLVFVNINLAILNLMPIPVLDGGHMMFATIAKVSGRPIPQRFLESTQVAFALLLFSFMIYVTFFDVGRIFDKIVN